MPTSIVLELSKKIHVHITYMKNYVLKIKDNR